MTKSEGRTGRPRQPGGKGDHARKMKSVRVTLTQELYDAIHRLAVSEAPSGEDPNWSATLRDYLRGHLSADGLLLPPPKTRGARAK